MKEIRHIGIIMDGNRRWAHERKLSPLQGHFAGAKRVEPTVIFAAERGIPHITFWAFSSENWNRGQQEVGMLMTVFRRFLQGKAVSRMAKEGVKLSVIGRYKQFPDDIVRSIDQMTEDTKDNTRINVNIALNYGGRKELEDAFKEMVAQGITAEQITDEVISQHVYTRDIPDPDLIIRTGGEQRLSGFLSWQATYSELYFTDTLWPDFDERQFALALDDYASRDRRFGK